MTGCSTEDMLVNKSFQDRIIHLQILPLLPLAILLSLDLYQFHLDYLDLLLFVSVHCPLSLKHDDANGEGNSSKKNSLKTHLKEHARTPSSSRQLTLEVKSRIQQSSEGVMLQFFSSYYLLDTHLIHLCIPSPSYMFHPLPQPSITHITYALLTP